MTIEEKIKLHNQLGKDIANYYKDQDGIDFKCLYTEIVPVAMCEANDYNPNRMPKKEMALLYECISRYGFLFPDLAYYDDEKGKYIIIDGFHRWEAIRRKKKKYIPIINMDVALSDRVQLTILMNRIKGMHQVESMSDIVVKLNTLGMDDVEIAKNLGMEAEEYIRLKQQIGIAAYYRNHQYSKSWE